MDYIENYASELSRIFKEYKKEGLEPIISTSSTAFKVTFPNKNYEELYLNPEKHLEDNKSITSFTHTKAEKIDIRKVDLNKRNSNIYRIIKQNLGLRSTQLLELLKVTDTEITLNIFEKSIKQLSEFIEFRGSSKTGGYFIKD